MTALLVGLGGLLVAVVGLAAIDPHPAQTAAQSLPSLPVAAH